MDVPQIPLRFRFVHVGPDPVAVKRSYPKYQLIVDGILQLEEMCWLLKRNFSSFVTTI